MKTEPFFAIHEPAVKGDRWSFGGNLAYEKFGQVSPSHNLSEYYATVNFLYWNVSVGVKVFSRVK